MAQITIYIPDEIEAKVRKAARRQKTSVSRWIAGQLTERLKSTWPADVLDAFGAFPEFPDARTLRRGYGKDASREPVE